MITIRVVGHSSRPLGGAEGQQWNRAGEGQRGGGAEGQVGQEMPKLGQ